jgi:hypothetical protein
MKTNNHYASTSMTVEMAMVAFKLPDRLLAILKEEAWSEGKFVEELFVEL